MGSSKNISTRELSLYPEVMTAKMVASYLGLGYTKTLRLLRHGDIPCLQLGNTFRVHRDILYEYLCERKSSAS